MELKTPNPNPTNCVVEVYDVGWKIQNSQYSVEKISSYQLLAKLTHLNLTCTSMPGYWYRSNCSHHYQICTNTL